MTNARKSNINFVRLSTGRRSSQGHGTSKTHAVYRAAKFERSEKERQP